MPQLNAAKAAEVEKAEGGNFEPVPEAVYVLYLAEEVVVKDGPKGPYWKWTFKVDGETEGQEQYKGRQLWQNTSLAEGAEWKLNETFAAFGVPTTTHTDDLIGKKVKAFVVQRPIESGPRKGEMSNEIKNLMPLSDVTPAGGAAGATPPAGSAPKPEAVPLF